MIAGCARPEGNVFEKLKRGAFGASEFAVRRTQTTG